MIVAASGPSPLWYITRGTGTALLVMLILTFSLGVASALGGRSARWPRFLSSSLHRNLSLIALVLLPIHVVTAIADPFARMAWHDAVVPFVSPYRPVWTGFGVVAAELFLLLILTSAIRPLTGHPVWRAIHWLAYLSLPVAVLHSLGDGTDARAPWSMAVTVAGVAAVVMVIAARVGSTPRVGPTGRATIAAVVAVTVTWGTAWATTGPLQPGWAWKSGTPSAVVTPAKLKPKASPSPVVVIQPAVMMPDGRIQDPVQGTQVNEAGGGVRLVLTDLHEPALQVVIRTARPGEPATALALVRSGKVTCIAPAVVGDSITATCGQTKVMVVLARYGDVITGQLVRTGP